jgi:hypothetical protein
VEGHSISNFTLSVGSVGQTSEVVNDCVVSNKRKGKWVGCESAAQWCLPGERFSETIHGNSPVCGIQCGTVVGASYRLRAHPIADQQTPENLATTLYGALGNPRQTVWHDTDRRPYELYRSQPIAGLT